MFLKTQVKAQALCSIIRQKVLTLNCCGLCIGNHIACSIAVQEAEGAIILLVSDHMMMKASRAPGGPEVMAY